MLIPLLAFVQARPVADASAVVNLYRGAAVYGPKTFATYQDVEDTVLDRKAPDSNHGGDYTLIGGDGHTILIRFGDLPNAVGRNARVLNATLILTSTTNDKLVLHSIGAVNRPWGEGPFKTVGNVLKAGVEPPKENPEAFAATWRARLAGLGGTLWRTPGAIGPDVTQIPEATGSTLENHFEITGLGPAVNTMLTDPGSNHGFAITFAGDAEFFSSESTLGKPRLLLTIAPAADSSAGDIAVETIVPTQGGYVATLRNRGAEAVGGLQATWTVESQPGATSTLPGPIPPGQQAQVRFNGSVRTNALDHRFGALEFHLSSAPNDQHLADKELTLYTAGLPISVLMTRETLAALESASSARGRGAASWAQSQIDFVNDVVLARSRFSFATDGCRERIRLAEIKEIGPLVDGPAPTGIPVEANSATRLDFGFIHRLLVAIGAPDLAFSSFPLGSPNVKLADWNVGGLGPCPDLTGGGDTRYEGGIPRQTLLPQVPSFESFLSAPGLEPTGLLSASAVGTLNALVPVAAANRSTARVPAANIMPATMLLDTYDATGSPLKNVDLAFFQCHDGVITAQAAFNLSVGASGTALLPRRRVPGTTISNLFGSQNLAADGAFLVRATAPGGATGWGWLRAWQLVDAAYRGDTEFASVPIHLFMTATSIDHSTNRAFGRVVTDSSGSLPAKLAPLVDGQGRTTIELPQKAGDWIEIDLNRDWTLAELRLTEIGAAPWDRFAIKVFQTGQKPASAIDWFSEADWNWSALNRGVVDADGRVSVSYCGLPIQIRYIRIVCLQAGPGRLTQIGAFSTRIGG